MSRTVCSLEYEHHTCAAPRLPGVQKGMNRTGKGKKHLKDVEITEFLAFPRGSQSQIPITAAASSSSSSYLNLGGLGTLFVELDFTISLLSLPLILDNRLASVATHGRG